MDSIANVTVYLKNSDSLFSVTVFYVIGAVMSHLNVCEKDNEIMLTGLPNGTSSTIPTTTEQNDENCRQLNFMEGIVLIASTSIFFLYNVVMNYLVYFYAVKCGLVHDVSS